MSREPKPYFKTQQQRWVCTIDGKRITLGADKKTAFEKFHQLMLNRECVQVTVSTVQDLANAYLDWCETNRSKATYDLHRTYLGSLLDSCGRTVKVGDFKPHHVTKWIASFNSSTTKHNVVAIAQRMFNWAVDEQYLTFSPIGKMKKPASLKRNIVYTPDQWEQIKEHATGSLLDLLDFIWLTGCRPQEVRTLSACHLHGDMVIFPPVESKGKTHSRVIYLIPQSRAILERLSAQHPSGPLFRNSRGIPWTKDAIKCRLTRISKKVGFRVIAYGARHSFATNALIRSVDTVSLSHLMGHQSTRMINNYSHLVNNVSFLQQQARHAAGFSAPADPAAPPSASTETE